MRIILFGLLACLIQPVLVCKCRVLPPVTGFCQADYGIRAKVLTDKQETKYNITTDHGTYVVNGAFYEVNVMQVLRGADKLVNVTRAKTFPNSTWNAYIYTSRSSASCGVTLQKGEEYLLTGYVREDRPNIGSCGLTQLYKSDDIRDIIENGTSVCLRQNTDADSADTGKVLVTSSLFLLAVIASLFVIY